MKILSNWHFYFLFGLFFPPILLILFCDFFSSCTKLENCTGESWSLLIVFVQSQRNTSLVSVNCTSCLKMNLNFIKFLDSLIFLFLDHINLQEIVCCFIFFLFLYLLLLYIWGIYETAATATATANERKWLFVSSNYLLFSLELSVHNVYLQNKKGEKSSALVENQISYKGC